MLTLTLSEEPDSYNIDYYYSRYHDRFGLGMNENKPNSLKVLPYRFKPDSCDILKTAKKLHYFQIPTQPAIGTCYCRKYYTSFISQYYRLLYSTTASQPQPQTITSISKNQFKKITDELPASPITKTLDQSEPSDINSKILFPNF